MAGEAPGSCGITPSPRVTRAIHGAPDGADAVDKLRPEDDVGVVEHAFLERDHDELARAEMGLEHGANVLENRGGLGEARALEEKNPGKRGTVAVPV